MLAGVIEGMLAQAGVPATWVAGLEPGVLGRLALAALLGGAVGLERELWGKPAGLRTNLLICIGAALFTELSLDLPAARGEGGDPARIAAQVVTGIGFLGAGTILHARGRVSGLTTAATVWVTAAIGVAVGAHAYARAVWTTALVLVSLVALGKLEAMRLNQRVRRRYRMELAAGREALAEAERLVREVGLAVAVVGVRTETGRIRATFDATGTEDAHDRLIPRLAAHPAVRRMARVRAVPT